MGWEGWRNDCHMRLRLRGCRVTKPTLPPKHADSPTRSGLRPTDPHIHTDSFHTACTAWSPVAAPLSQTVTEADVWFHFFTASAVQLPVIQSHPCYLLHLTGSKVTLGMAARSWVEMNLHSVWVLLKTIITSGMSTGAIRSHSITERLESEQHCVEIWGQGHFFFATALQKISHQQVMYQTSRIDRVNFAAPLNIHALLWGILPRKMQITQAFCIMLLVLPSLVKFN